MVAAPARSREYTDACTREDAVRAIETVLNRGRIETPSQSQLNDLADAIEALLLRNDSVAAVLALRAAYYELGDRMQTQPGLPLRTLEDVERCFTAVKATVTDP